MEAIINIEAEKRSGKGKQDAKRLRKSGLVPAVVYGGKDQVVNLAIDVNTIRRIIRSEHGENSILRLKYDKTSTDAMVKEIQLDYLSENIVHVDLIRIDLKKTIDVSVPIVLAGEPVGVKLEDGILEFLTREIEVRCLPGLIPREINLDISGLHAGQSIKLENLELPEGVKPVTTPQTVICMVAAKAREEAAAVEEAPEAEQKTEAEEA